jgi:uncharacterized protein YcnI
VIGVRRLALAPVVLVSVIFPAAAGAHARVSPAVSLSGQLQLYSLAVPTEKTGASTSKILLTVPRGFSIDSFVPSPGWERVVRETGSGNGAVVAQVTWTGGHVPSGEDSLFQFLAQPASAGTYAFTVQQSYSDGSVVNWSGPESSDAPSPRVEARSSLGGSGGVSALTIVAVILAVLGLLTGGLALATGGRRPLA